VILVAGDSMLDRYWTGKVERISPEAPVPVLQVTSETCRAGGAANVALNLAALGTSARLLTPIANDSAGDALRGLLGGVAVVSVPAGKTLEKIRLVATRQQLLRADFEGELPADKMAEMFHSASHGCSAVILSDYAKGSLGRCQEMIQAANCPVFVDPKGDFEKYRGAFLLKPNEAEIGPLVAKSDFACDYLRRSLDIKYLLVTLGERGMVLFYDEGVAEFPADAREIYDVSGAGDTVIATVAHFVADGMDIHDAVRMANKAAGIVVGKFGTATVSADELH
jgi:rfaE bifunctional protein kinase chain/domain